MLAGDIEYFSWFAIPHDHFPTEISEQSTNLWLSERTNRAEILDAEITRLRARVAELEAALRPFAAEAVKIDGDPEWFGNGRYSDDKTCILSGLTMGQLRATRAALEEKDA
jgi:hypothetical protein